jgi:hypothetical protein
MSTNFGKVSKDQLRAVLNYAGWPEDKIAEVSKRKEDLGYAVIQVAEEVGQTVESLLLETSSDDNESLANVDFSNVDLLPEAEVEDVYEGETPLTQNSTPLYDSHEWSDYVKGFFEEDELYDGNPTVPGLRRIAGMLLGRITFSGPITLQTHYPEDPNHIGRASVMYEIKIENWMHGADAQWISEEDILAGRLPTRVFRAASGFCMANAPKDPTFAVHSEAMAETRAEARALRKALNLRNVVAHEEVATVDPSEAFNATRNYGASASVEWNPDEELSSNQRLHITSKCKQLGINIEKFINVFDDCQFDSINDVSKGAATRLIAELTEYQTSSVDSKSIPSEILLEDV